jgi:two-component system nitrogen regulation sensor histidine kinase NtrY
MRLAPRLVLAFGFVAALSVSGLGYVVREDRRASETVRFDREVGSACTRVRDELLRQAESDRKLVAGACQSGELVDRTFVAMEGGDLDTQRLALAALVPREREAFDLDELMLVTDQGDVLGADPKSLLGTARSDVQASLKGDAKSFTLRSSLVRPALVARCKRQGQGGRAVGLVGARSLGPILERLGHTLSVNVSAGAPKPAAHDVAEATCTLGDAAGASLAIHVSKPKKELNEALAHIDETVLFAGLASTGVALVLAVLLARSLARPLAEVATEARKVATGEARPLRVRGSGEIGELVTAFDRMIEDLAVTRRRLAATSRVAAWREVARRVAHEVKNPLAPIRAAVETLRRLRARNDPAFDEYFDEATRTVLSEVHRIATIVTEFTRFARLPPPRPQEVDVMELVRGVVQLQKANAGAARLELVTRRVPPIVRADRDQVIQILTNLVKNALEAVEGQSGGDVVVTLDTDGKDHVSLTVADNGPGIAPEITARLFEPYATTKANGTGLGLAIAQRIAMEHNGELACLSSGARGAVFRLVLPIEGPPPLSEAPPSSG